MSFYNFKKVQVVPTANDFIDIVLSKTQRKTPTVVHKNYQISRIRNFYMRKVKFTQDTFDEKLTQILTDFPKLDEIHPFYADLMNVLYDRDHYKLALGQINTAKHLIDNVGRDYVRLLKFGDSLYRCKQLKKAALGRMATIMKRQKDTLAYLEQVRQHLARLPSIDPNTRTLLICGYPNVGKSSFINKLTRAEVEVQPYAFTTKSLFVGHMDYSYLRWQVIDTPGILDHPLEDRNTIEMLSITALAHLRACVLYFMDLSERCGYTIAEQAKLFHSIKPLFNNKPIVLVINKVDVRRPEDLGEEEAAILRSITGEAGVEVVELSCYTDEGVMNARNFACEKLLKARVESKLRGNKVANITNRIHVAQPAPRDEKVRAAFIPESAKIRVKYDPTDPARRLLARDIEAMEGGAGVYNINLKNNYLLSNDEWKQDIIPEIMEGHNVADFIDPEIEERLKALEEEEDRLAQSGHYEETMQEVDEETMNLKRLAGQIMDKKKLVVQAHRLSKGKNRPVIPLKAKAKNASMSDMSSKLATLGIDTEQLEQSESVRTGRKRARSVDDGHAVAQSVMRTASSMRSMSRMRDRSEMGLRNVKQKMVAISIKKKSQRAANLDARKGEGDRVILNMRPKHLLSGKRKSGTTDRR